MDTGHQRKRGRGRASLKGQGGPQNITGAPHRDLGLLWAPLMAAADPRTLAVRLVPQEPSTVMCSHRPGQGQPVSERRKCPAMSFPQGGPGEAQEETWDPFQRGHSSCEDRKAACPQSQGRSHLDPPREDPGLRLCQGVVHRGVWSSQRGACACVCAHLCRQHNPHTHRPDH